MYVYIYIAYEYIHTNIHIYTFIHVWTYICMCVYTYISHYQGLLRLCSVLPVMPPPTYLCVCGVRVVHVCVTFMRVCVREREVCIRVE